MAIPESKLINPQNVEDNPDAEPSPEDAPESTPGARRISEKKLAANRANAQKSTGPTSEAGKKSSRMNALTHGLLARETVIRLGDYQEEFVEYLELLDDLWERYRPVGHAEELEVEIMAKCDWMEVRETRVTNATIRRRTLGLRQREERRRAEAFADVLAYGRNRSCLEETARGLRYLIDMMKDVKAQMQAEKLEGTELPEKLQESLAWLVTNYPKEFTQGPETKTQTRYASPVTIVGPAYVQQVVAALDQQLSRLVPLQSKTAWLEEEQLKAKIEAAALPVRYLERTGRYMTTKDRRRKHSLERLEALQRARKASGRLWPVQGA